MALGFNEQVQEAMSHLNSLEEAMGKCLNQPNAGANSGPRELMSSVHQSHTLVLNQGEVPYVHTGFENRFADESSSIITAEGNLQVLAKISKFSYAPDHHYYLIVMDTDTQKLDVIERVSYKFRTEVYGYLHNNSTMDSYSAPGTIIPKGTRLRKSIAFDSYDNRASGRNLLTGYMALDNNMEDSVVISEDCSKKMSAALFDKVPLILNENDIPMNSYGDDNIYKSFPDIGEDVKDGIIMIYRREKRDEAIFSQSVSRLQKPMMSDDRIMSKGKVIDINIYCNNPEHIAKSAHNQQLYAYYQDKLRMCQEIVDTVGPYVTQKYEITYRLKELYDNALGDINHRSNDDDGTFSFVKIEFITMNSRPLTVGDKIADRYGGKGVVSKIIPTDQMPRMHNGRPLDAIKNSATMYGRENAGQVFELDENFIGMNILDKIRSGAFTPNEAMDQIILFSSIISEQLGKELKAYTDTLNQEELIYFIESYLRKVAIPVSARPMSETMTIDRLAQLYDAFKWVKQETILVPIRNSNGEIRFVDSRRPVVVAPIFHIRLKQFSEEKFSATSLSSTNIKNENAKSKSFKNHRTPNSNTPIRFGQMESGDLDHIGTEYVVLNLLMLSLSPHARRLVEEAAVGDPYNVDIKLDSRAKNRSAEILNARLKTMGYRIKFIKRRKHKPLGAFIPGVEFFEGSVGHPVEGVEFVQDPTYDFDHWYKTLKEIEDIRRKNGVNIMGVSFIDDYQYVDDSEVIEYKD